MTAKITGSLLILLTVLLSGCGRSDLAKNCRAVGVCADEPLPAVQIDLLCDGSNGSSCTPQSFRATLDTVLPYAAHRPGSLIRVWMLGGDVGETALVAEQQAAKPTKSGAKAIRTQEARWAESARNLFMGSIAPNFERVAKNRSPLAEALAKIGLASTGSLPRITIVISDSREFSQFGDWECGPMPTAPTFIRQLGVRRVLVPGSFQGASLRFSFVTNGSVSGQRCKVTIARATQIQELWRAALKNAGAINVSFESGVVSFTN